WNRRRQIKNGGRSDGPTALGQIAGYIKARAAGILSMQPPSARSNHPFGIRVPGNAEPRRKVRFVIGDEPVAEPAIPRNLDRRVESEGNTFVEIPRSLAHESWVTAQVCYIRIRIHKRHIEV